MKTIVKNSFLLAQLASKAKKQARLNNVVNQVPAAVATLPALVIPAAAGPAARVTEISIESKNHIAQLDQHFILHGKKSEPAAVTPHVANTLEVGAILYSSWGYDQTNIDFYCVVKISGAYAYLKEMTEISGPEDGFMTASKMPGVIKEDAETIKRKIKNYSNAPYLSISSFESAYLFDGQAKRYSWYA